MPGIFGTTKASTRPGGLHGRLVNKSYSGVFLSGLKWLVCHGGLGTLLLRNLHGQGKYPISPAWTSHEIYFCVANEETNPPATNQTSDRIPTAPTESRSLMQDRGLLEGAVWSRQRLCVSAGAGCWGGGSSSGLRRQNSVSERQPHRPVPHSSHRPREAHNPLAVSRGFRERKWEGRGKETELAEAAWGPQFIASPTDSRNWLARGVLH